MVRQQSWGSDVSEPLSPVLGHQRVGSWGQEQSSLQRTSSGALSGRAQGACFPEFRGSLAGAAQGVFTAQSSGTLPPGALTTGLTAARVESLHAPQLRTGFGPPSTPQPMGAPPACQQAYHHQRGWLSKALSKAHQ